MIIALASVWLIACGGPPDAVCTQDIPCGWGETCVGGTCRAGICATSAQCPMEQHCDSGACVEGCERDSDCFPGAACEPESGVCQSTRCEDTRVDCGFREFCDPTSGDCFDAGSQYCRPCTDNTDCGVGNVCFARGCGVDCALDPCPNGFDCIPIVDNAGQIQTYQCITYCWIYDDSWPSAVTAAAGAATSPPYLINDGEVARAPQ